MDFTLRIRNMPRGTYGTWWQAGWLPQGLFTPWLTEETDYYTFTRAEPRGFLWLQVWGVEQFEPGEELSYKLLADKRSHAMRPREGSEVVFDFAARPWLLPVAAAASLAAILALARR